MAEMTDNEALAALSALDSEIGALLAQRQAAKRVGDVIAHYREVRKRLDSLKKDEADVEVSIKNLSDRYAAENRKAREELQAATATYRQEATTAQGKMQEAQEQLKKVETKLADAEKYYETRTNELNKLIETLTMQYDQKAGEFEKLMVSLENWKKQHNL